jgi:hypothetical protein
MRSFKEVIQAHDFRSTVTYLSLCNYTQSKRATSPVGTFETCRHTATMSVYGGRAEVVGTRPNRRF